MNSRSKGGIDPYRRRFVFEFCFCKHRIAICFGCFWTNNDTHGWQFRFPRLLRYIQSVQAIFFSSDYFSILPMSWTFDPLHHHSSRRPSTVAYSRDAVLTRLELMQQRGQDPRAGAAERMPERDGAAERVDV